MSYHPAKYMSDMGATKINFLTVKVSKLSSTYGCYHLSPKLSCICHRQVSCWGGRYCSRVNILWQIVNRSKGHLNRYESDRSMSHCKCLLQLICSRVKIFAATRHHKNNSVHCKWEIITFWSLLICLYQWVCMTFSSTPTGNGVVIDMRQEG